MSYILYKVLWSPLIDRQIFQEISDSGSIWYTGRPRFVGVSTTKVTINEDSLQVPLNDIEVYLTTIKPPTTTVSDHSLLSPSSPRCSNKNF